MTAHIANRCTVNILNLTAAQFLCGFSFWGVRKIKIYCCKIIQSTQKGGD